MKQSIKVSMVQFSAEWAEPEINIRRMREMAEAEAKAGAELIVFPELSNIGYCTPCLPAVPVDFEGMSYAECAMKYVSLAETIPGPTTNALLEVAREYGVYIVVGMTQQHPAIPYSVYNAAALLGPDGVIGVHHKMHLPLEEKQYFYPGSTAEVFDTPLGKIGLGICYDGRFPEYSRMLALKGAEIICNIWATIVSGNNSVGPNQMKAIKYRTFTRAQENGVFYLSCNRSGKQGNQFVFSGHSCAASPNGVIIASSETMEEEILRCTLDRDDLIRYRSTLPIFRDRRPEMYQILTAPLSEPYAKMMERCACGAEKDMEEAEK